MGEAHCEEPVMNVFAIGGKYRSAFQETPHHGQERIHDRQAERDERN
jgi:hypothetical protein